MTGTGNHLEVHDLHVSYGQIAALRGVSIQVACGETVCVVGPNGAGKSTLMSAIAGGLRSKDGRVTLGGKDISSSRPEDIARLGVSLVPEGRRIFSTLTVEENLKVAGYLRGDSKRSASVMKEIMEMFPILGERRSYPAGRLSGGEQQMLAVGRAIMTEPTLIMVDEPSLGLAPKIVDQVYAMLDKIRRERGVTLLINEQSSTRVMQYATRIYVLRGGLVQLNDAADNLRDGEAIKKAYFGFADSGEKKAQP
ncbi:ABC transporter ATP-binding protein [Rhizobium sp. Root1204]|uniref:ABC transporter ATP-binding protein n=1 Tax=Rhizobium sp. Root1204 TaxID=1736428 RepID=UPI0007126E45|nr:ABC transporter ATP-binding protein [Rhizobium sp. Root1204]KQV36979.1 ABC transporter ATP-binding protein [Rhizobium sp. Root1204]